MPIYDFQCSACQHRDEVMRKVSASSEVEACPACGEVAFSKQLSAPSFQLSGTGWYATDFKNSGSKPAAKKETTENTASDDSKPSDAGNSCAPGCGCH